MRRFVWLALALLTALPAAAASGSCGWIAPRDLPLVETHARYWRLDLELPAGAEILVQGRFPYARQISFNVHDAKSAALIGGIADVDLAPDATTRNPFVANNPRWRSARGYSALFTRKAGSDKPGHTVLGGRADETVRLRILYRIYLPDADKAGGGVALPKVFIVEGKKRLRIAGGAACPVPGIVDAAQEIGPTRVPPAAGAASLPLDWRLAGASAENSDVFVNRDNGYAYALTRIEPGRVLLLAALAPTFPPTLQGEKTMAGGQVRYWSICAYRHPSDRSAACLADEALAPHGGEAYQLALIAPEDAAALGACAVPRLVAPASGDGALILRHVAPNVDFPHTPLRGAPTASAAAVLGPYLPQAELLLLAVFKSKHCS